MPVSRAKARESSGFAALQKAMRLRYARLTYRTNCCALKRRRGAVGIRRRRRSGDRLQQEVSDHAVAYRFVKTNFDFHTFSPDIALSKANSSSGSPVQSGAAL